MHRSCLGPSRSSQSSSQSRRTRQRVRDGSLPRRPAHQRDGWRRGRRDEVVDGSVVSVDGPVTVNGTVNGHVFVG